MAFTVDEIQDKKDELSAVKTAYIASLETGSVTDFRQGSTEFKKASSAELKKIMNSLENEVYRMDR